MIDVKTAIRSAYQYLDFVKDMIGEQLEDLRLEEVELAEDKHFWLITLGYDVPIKSRNRLEELLAPPNPTTRIFRREYKLFRVNSETGEVEAMKMRQV